MLFPDPSIPSTTMSLPRGASRLRARTRTMIDPFRKCKQCHRRFGITERLSSCKRCAVHPPGNQERFPHPRAPRKPCPGNSLAISGLRPARPAARSGQPSAPAICRKYSVFGRPERSWIAEKARPPALERPRSALPASGTPLAKYADVGLARTHRSEAIGSKRPGTRGFSSPGEGEIR